MSGAGYITGVKVGDVYVIRDGKRVKVPNNYNPGPKRGARWNDPCEPHNRGREIRRKM